MSLDLWFWFVATTFLVSATPGPNMLLVMHHGIQYGFRRSLLTCAGLLTGLAIYIALSFAGLGALLLASPYLFTLIRYAGAACLVFLGINAWFARPLSTSSGQTTAMMPASRRFWRGFWVAMGNPKALVFFAALFPQFIRLNAPQGPQIVILAVSFYIIESGWQMAYAAGGARLGNWLSSPRHLRLVNRLSAVAFILAGLLLSVVGSH